MPVLTAGAHSEVNQPVPVDGQAKGRADVSLGVEAELLCIRADNNIALLLTPVNTQKFPLTLCFHPAFVEYTCVSTTVLLEDQDVTTGGPTPPAQFQAPPYVEESDEDI